MRRLFVAAVLVATVWVAAPVDAQPDTVHAVGPAQIESTVAHPGLSDDICRYIIAARGHPKDIVRTHLMIDGNHVYCAWWHMIETSPGVWHTNHQCHQGDYFVSSGNYYPGPLFSC